MSNSTKQMVARGTYTTDCLRKVQDEDGTVRVARMVEERPISVSLDVRDSKVFWKGGRIA